MAGSATSRDRRMLDCATHSRNRERDGVRLRIGVNVRLSGSATVAGLPISEIPVIRRGGAACAPFRIGRDDVAIRHTANGLRREVITNIGLNSAAAAHLDRLVNGICLAADSDRQFQVVRARIDVAMVRRLSRAGLAVTEIPRECVRGAREVVVERSRGEGNRFRCGAWGRVSGVLSAPRLGPGVACIERQACLDRRAASGSGRRRSGISASAHNDARGGRESLASVENRQADCKRPTAGVLMRYGLATRGLPISEGPAERVVRAGEVVTRKRRRGERNRLVGAARPAVLITTVRWGGVHDENILVCHRAAAARCRRSRRNWGRCDHASNNILTQRNCLTIVDGDSHVIRTRRSEGMRHPLSAGRAVISKGPGERRVRIATEVVTQECSDVERDWYSYTTPGAVNGHAATQSFDEQIRIRHHWGTCRLRHGHLRVQRRCIHWSRNRIADGH